MGDQRGSAIVFIGRSLFRGTVCAGYEAVPPQVTDEATPIRGPAQKRLYGKLANMKTTLELPDELMRRVKLRAVHRYQKLKDVVAQLLEAGIAAPPGAEPSANPPKPVRLK